MILTMRPARLGGDSDLFRLDVAGRFKRAKAKALSAVQGEAAGRETGALSLSPLISAVKAVHSSGFNW